MCDARPVGRLPAMKDRQTRSGALCRKSIAAATDDTGWLQWIHLCNLVQPIRHFLLLPSAQNAFILIELRTLLETSQQIETCQFSVSRSNTRLSVTSCNVYVFTSTVQRRRGGTKDNGALVRQAYETLLLSICQSKPSCANRIENRRSRNVCLPAVLGIRNPDFARANTPRSSAPSFLPSFLVLSFFSDCSLRVPLPREGHSRVEINAICHCSLDTLPSFLPTASSGSFVLWGHATIKQHE